MDVTTLQILSQGPWATYGESKNRVEKFIGEGYILFSRNPKASFSSKDLTLLLMYLLIFLMLNDLSFL